VHSGRPKSSISHHGAGKPRHLRDRLDSMTSESLYHEAANRKRSIESEDNNADDEPYAWISQTAPSSPIVGRSRAASEGLDGDKSGSIFATPAISVERIGDKVSKFEILAKCYARLRVFTKKFQKKIPQKKFQKKFPIFFFQKSNNFYA
jgi:hypothetical protein